MPRVPPAPQTVVTESVGSAPIQAPLQRDRGVDVSGLAQGFDVAADAFEKANLQLSQIRLSEAETEVMARWNARLYEDDDAYYKLQGKESVEALDDRMKELAEIQNDVSSRLQTGREKRIFNTAMTGRHQQSRVKMSMRSFDERQQWDKTTSIANMQAQLESAANDSSVENLRVTKARIEEEAASIARIDGLPPEEQARAAGVAVSGMYRAAIETTMIADLDHAQSLFDRFGDEILADDRLAISKALKDRTITQRSREEADRIRANGGTLEDQLAAARRIKNTEVRDRTVTRITSSFNQDEAADAQQNRDLYNSLGSDVLDGSSTDAIRTSLPDAWASITQAQREHLISIEKAQGKTIVTDWGRWSDLTLMPVNELARIHPMDERLNLADSQYKDLLTLVKEARTGSPGFALTSIVSPYQRLVIAAGGANKLKKDKGQLLTRELTERLDAFEKNKGSKATPKEIDDIIDPLIVEVEIPGSVSRFPILRLLTPDPDVQVFQITITDVPTDDQNKITEYYQRTFGRVPSENEIIDAYGLKLNEQ